MADFFDDYADDEELSVAESEKLIGCQTPRLHRVPDGDPTNGDYVVRWVRDVAGLTLLPWQEELVRDFFRTRKSGKWSSRELVSVVPRQNGKGEVLLAIELAHIFLWKSKTIFHTAHLMDTAISAQKRLWEVVSDSEALMWWDNPTRDPSLQPRIYQSNGKEEIDFPATGAHVYFRTRTAKTARGMSVDLLIYDECFTLPNEVFAAMDKTTNARRNSQKVFISSPVDRYKHAHGAIFSAKRWAAVDGKTRATLLAEWSAEEEDDPLALDTWCKANPSLGPVVQLDGIREDAASASTSADIMRAFRVETLAIGNWFPRDGENAGDFVPIVDQDVWAQRADPQPRWVGDDLAVGFDSDPEGKEAAVVVAFPTETGVHVSVQPGGEFDRDAIVSGISALIDRYDPLAVVVDSKGPSATTIRQMEQAGVVPEQMSSKTITQACETFLALFAEGRITHDGNPRWAEALKTAKFRSLTSGRAIERFTPDGCLFVAATFAIWGLQTFAIPEHVDVPKKKVLTHAVAQAVPATTGLGGYDFNF